LLSAKKIQAGKSGQIEARIRTESLSGPVEKQITITTNDPQNALIKLSIKALVEPEIEISASSIFWGSQPAAKEARVEIFLTVSVAKSVKLLSAASTDSNVSAVLETVPGSNGKKSRLIVIRKPNVKPGYHFGKIVVKTTSRLKPELEIYEQGTVTSP
jgi:hypothetical protein